MYNTRFISFLLSLAILRAHGRTFTVVNACPFTIWPAMFTDLTAGTAVPDFPTGWEAPPSASVTFTVPDNWTAGRIWGRRDCDFTITSGPTCLDGWCNGGLLCDPTTGTGVPPATVAEWTLQGDGNRDFYDVSLVDGYNLPMAITNSANCPVSDCPVDLGPSCPDPLKGPFDPTGFPVGCKSACFANLDGNPNDSANCCSGSHSTAATCPPSGVQFYDYFKGNCPNAYAYAFDEASGSALFTCDSGANADYTLTFCPPATTSNAASASAPENGSAITSASGTSPVAGGSSGFPPANATIPNGSPTSTVPPGSSSVTPTSSPSNSVPSPAGRNDASRLELSTYGWFGLLMIAARLVG
ncbi:thaumatin family-domain-containing protein [Daedaleopsis nitida]|nr:thaumatin family-domain-containing protein [Daedaleopsis nitida]